MCNAHYSRRRGKKSPATQFGGITNGHTEKLDGPWSFSFESKFDAIDSRFPYLVEELLECEAKTSLITQPLEERFRAHSTKDGFTKELGATLASLIVRSPRHRNSIKKTTEYFQGRFGFTEPNVDKNLINMNLAHKLEMISENFHGGKFIIAFSDEAEFIFGDGFYTNMAVEGFCGHRKTVLPITPVVTVIYSRPMSYLTEPKLITIRLGNSEVQQFNELVQIYSKDQLFYRNQKPKLSQAYQSNEFLNLKHHECAWLDSFLEVAHRYRG